MPLLTRTFWKFAGLVHTYFVTSVSAEVRDTSARWVGSRGGGGLCVRKVLFPRPHGAVLLVTVMRIRASRNSPFASSCEICGHSSAKSIFRCILVTQIIEDLMQQISRHCQNVTNLVVLYIGRTPPKDTPSPVFFWWGSWSSGMCSGSPFCSGPPALSSGPPE